MIYQIPIGSQVDFNMHQHELTADLAGTYKNLVDKSCSGESDFFCCVRDFICKRDATHLYASSGIGWELIDSSYSVDEDNTNVGDWYVIKSTTDEGLNLYYRIVYLNALYLQVEGYQYWNDSLHTGTNQFYNNAAHIPLDGGFTNLWIYGDLNALTIITEVSSTYYAFMFGSTSSGMYDHNVVTSLDPVSSGSNQLINCEENIASYIDDYAFLFDDSHIEIVLLTDINIENKSLTCDVTNDYPSGAHLVPEHGAFIQATNDLTSANNFRKMIGHNSAPNVSGNWDVFATLLDEHDPESLNNDYLTTKISISGSGLWGYLRNIQIMGFGVSLADEEVLNDRTGNWRLFTINGFKLLFREV